MDVYQFKIEINNTFEPLVWRRVLVDGPASLHDLHLVIQAAFGWEDSHSYMFSKKGYDSNPRYLYSDAYDDDEIDSDEVELSEIFNKANRTFNYIYDFGDDWIHKIKLERLAKDDINIPICTAGEGACPPEDCGGPWAYEIMKRQIADQKNPNYHDKREWLGLKKGQKWDASAFDIEKVNARLRRLGAD